MTFNYSGGETIYTEAFHSGSFTINQQQVTVKVPRIVELLGVPVNQADRYLTELISEEIEKCHSICNPKGYYAIFPNPVFSHESEEMHLSGKTFHIKKMVAAGLKKSSSIALFAGTCGEEIEQQSRQLIGEGHHLEGLITDLIGSEIAESIAGVIHKKIGEEATQNGYKVTNRYSPGYCQWNVADQQSLFTLLGEKNCGIRLTDSSLMLPIKSVSGIVGLGTEVQFRHYSCNQCDAAYCLYRDKKRGIKTH